jgi:hypothetical protein
MTANFPRGEMYPLGQHILSGIIDALNVNSDGALNNEEVGLKPFPYGPVGLGDQNHDLR